MIPLTIFFRLSLSSLAFAIMIRRFPSRSSASDKVARIGVIGMKFTPLASGSSRASQRSSLFAPVKVRTMRQEERKERRRKKVDRPSSIVTSRRAFHKSAGLLKNAARRTINSDCDKASGARARANTLGGGGGGGKRGAYCKGYCDRAPRKGYNTSRGGVL